MNDEEGWESWIEMETIKSPGPHPFAVAAVAWMILLFVLFIVYVTGK